jgi:hypothetical protein
MKRINPVMLVVSSAIAIVSAIGCLALSGCATVRTEKAFDRASTGMSKAEVIKKVGRPAIVRGIIKNKNCETVEVWEYKVGKGKDFEQVATETVFTVMSAGAGAPLLISAAETDRCWVYFVDGKFAGWSRAGDWARDTDKICEMRFRPEETFSQKI